MSRRSAQRWFADACGVEISLGAISNTERRISEGLSGAHAEALASVRESSTKHLDETTWCESGSLAWLWAAVEKKATAFLIRDSRRAEVAKELIGEEPSGITIADRYGGDSFIDLGGSRTPLTPSAEAIQTRERVHLDHISPCVLELTVSRAATLGTPTTWERPIQ